MSHRAPRVDASARIALLAVALATTVGCGGPTAADTAPDPTNPVTAAPNQPAEPQRIQAAEIEPGRFSGEVVEVFGQDEVYAGYAQMAALSARITFQEDILGVRPDSDWTPSDFDLVAQRMTPQSADGYRGLVRDAIANDEQAASTLQGITYHNIGGEGIVLATEGPLVVNHRIGNPTAAVDRSTGSERLQVTFEQRGDLRISQNGTDMLVRTEKTISFALVRAPDGSDGTWLIDGIWNEWSVIDPVPDNGSY